MSDLISVVIPSYNKAPFICNTIESILNQTYSDFEIVIVDDGSTDDSLEKIEQRFNDERIKIIAKQNGGPSSARNRGVEESKGKWILFLDADDMLLPNALESFNKRISMYPKYKYFVGNFYSMRSESDIIIGSRRHYEGRVKWPFFFEAARVLTETSGTAMYDRKILLKDKYDENLRRYEDAERQYRLMRKYPLYMFSTPVSIINREAACASNPRENIEEDFIGHLDFTNKAYWEQMTLYLLALEGKCYYPEAASLYHNIYKRKKYEIGLLLIRLYNGIHKLYFDIIKGNQIYKLSDLK